MLKSKIFAIMLVFMQFVLGQNNFEIKDTIANNLVHTPNYITSVLGSIPKFTKSGKAKETLILIPGWGFDASIFNDFMEVNKKNYTMYAITVPGYGDTPAPQMPEAGSSYGFQTWNKGVQEGIVKLIKKDKIENPIIVGHSTQGTQLALRMAIDYPDIVKSVIVLGGHAKFIPIIEGELKEFPLDQMIKIVNTYTAPKWFKSISKSDFDSGNYLPEIYSLNSELASYFWNKSANVPLPVMIQYICEFFASDIITEIHKIKCPVLILRAMFTIKILEDPINNYVKSQFIDAWDGISEKNRLTVLKNINDSGTFVWKDQPDLTNTLINEFINNKNK